MIQIFALYLFFCRVQRKSMSLSPDLVLWRMLEAPGLGLESWSWFVYGHWSLILPCSEFHLSIFILKVHRTSLTTESWYGALKNTGGSLLGFSTFILIWIFSPFFDTPIFQNLSLYLDFDGAEDFHVLYFLIWGFQGCWRSLTGVWPLDIDVDMVTGLCYTHIPHLSSLSFDIEGAKNINVLFVLIQGFGGFWILILIWIWSLVFITPIIQIMALCLDF